MNKDFRITCSFPRHHKTQKLIRRLGMKAVSGFVFLLSHVAENRPSGNLDGMDAEDIAIAAQWDEDPEKFLAALIDIGFVEKDPLRIHEWKEHNGYAAHAEERSRIARENISKRWSRIRIPTDTNGIPTDTNGIPTDTNANTDYTKTDTPNPSPNPNPNPSKKTSPSAVEYSPEFLDFWDAYPRREGKHSAYKAWKARIGEGSNPKEMIASAKSYAESCASSGKEPRFIKQPSTFLNPDWKEWLDKKPERAPVKRNIHGDVIDPETGIPLTYKGKTMAQQIAEFEATCTPSNRQQS